MPNGVANWPEQCDPRSLHGGPCFCFEGNGELYPSPWQFSCNVGDTSPLFTGFGGTHLVPFSERIQPADACIWKVDIGGGLTIEITKVVFDPPAPLGWTISWELRFFLTPPPSSPVANGFVQVIEPLPALTLPDFAVGGPDGPWPDPVIVTPRAWDFEL